MGEYSRVKTSDLKLFTVANIPYQHVDNTKLPYQLNEFVRQIAKEEKRVKLPELSKAIF